MKLDDVFTHIGRPFAYYPKLAKALGGVNAALFTCLFAYWSGSESKKGWIYKTKNEIEEETGLSVGEQRTATKRLQELDVLKIKRIGIPAVNYYFFDWEKISVLIKKNFNENKNLKLRSVDLTHLDSDDVSDVASRAMTQNKICKNAISRSVDLTHLDASKEHIYTRQNDTSISKSTSKSTTEDKSAEPQIASPPVITIPLNDNSDFIVDEKQFKEWVDLFPAVDVKQELRNAKAWCLANPSRRKTKRGVKSFLTGWLTRTQDKPRVAPTPIRRVVV